MKEYIKQLRLLNEIKTLSYKVKGTKSLSTHERWEAQNNTLINLLKAEDEGRLQLDIFSDYKGYMFMSIRSQINKIFKTNSRLKNNFIISANQLAENEEVTLDEWISVPGAQYNGVHCTLNECVPGAQHLELIQIYKKRIKNLPPIDRAIIRWKARGWTFIVLGEALGISDQKVGRIYKKILADVIK